MPQAPRSKQSDPKRKQDTGRQQQIRESTKNRPDSPARHSPDEPANEEPHYESGSGHHEPHP